MSFKIYRDEYMTTERSTTSTILPLIDSNDLPNPVIPGLGGGIAYDTVTDRIYYSNGFTWLPVGSGGGSSVSSYGLIKDPPDQSISSSTPTIITNWTAPAPYETLPEWNLTTGTYTAASDSSFSISVNIAWESGTNLGVRIVRILYNGTPVKEAETQADPNRNVTTTQEIGISLSLMAGDTVQIEVEHTAPTSISILSGISTSVNGLKIL